MSNIVIFGATQSGKTTLLGYLATAMLRHPQLNDEILQKFKLIRNLTINDEFGIGNPYNPVNVKTDVILPSFVSLDKDELRKFSDGQSSEGTTKRIHRKQLSICVSERSNDKNVQNENANVPCTFIDIPGFRQRISDKYRGFYEGDIGIAVLKLSELLELWELLQSNSSPTLEEKLERRLFEPIRIWCSYRSASRLIIVISQIDRSWDDTLPIEAAINQQIKDIEKAIDCIQLYIAPFCKNISIPIAPISIDWYREPNIKKRHRMQIFFHRIEENIYIAPPDKHLPGDGTLIQCLNRIMPQREASRNRTFSMASVNKPMRAIVNNSPKTALNVRAHHGSIHQTDTIYMGPVRDKNTGIVIYTECQAASLKADGTLSPSDTLWEGNVGGIIFKSIKNIDNGTEYHLDSSSKKTDIAILKSTLLYSDRIKSGDILELEFLKKDYDTIGGGIDKIYSRILPSLMPFDQLSLFWYGKMITVNIVEIIKLEDRFRLSVIVSKDEQKSTHHFVLPCKYDNTLKHCDNVLIAIPHSFYSSGKIQKETYTYVNANVVEIKNSENYDKVQILAHYGMNLDVFLSGNLSFVLGIAVDDIDVLLLPFRNPYKQIDIYSVLTKVKQNIKKQFTREVYRDMGGVQMELISSSDSEEADICDDR
ncbi:MAG: hypothetical protein PUB19_08555 [Lachnospiraceae bacterium]|nr:hypothetical protein [Lachnospiraceae bacterium]